MEPTNSNRQCGPCVACCTTMGVEAIGKPERTRCPHQARNAARTRRGCTIYAERPEPCQTFECGWLRGMGSKHDRPDRLGVVFSAYDMGKGRTLHIAESKRGAADSPRVAEIITTARAEGVADQIVIVRLDGRRRLHVLGSDERFEWGPGETKPLT